MTEQTFTVSLASLDPSALYSSQSIFALFDAINGEARTRGEACGALTEGLDQVRRIKGESEKKPKVEAVGGIRVYVDGVEVDGAESVDERSMTVTRAATDEEGQILLNARGDDIVREVIAARREIRIVRG